MKDNNYKLGWSLYERMNQSFILRGGEAWKKDKIQLVFVLFDIVESYKWSFELTTQCYVNVFIFFLPPTFLFLSDFSYKLHKTTLLIFSYSNQYCRIRSIQPPKKTKKN